MDAQSASNSGKSSRRGIARALGNLFKSHVRLFSLELDESKEFFLAYFLYIAVCITCSVLFLILFSFVVIVFFWDSYRMTAILGLCGIYLLATLFSLWRLYRLRKNATFFKETVNELVKDQEELLS